jgi:hypothetical protein
MESVINVKQKSKVYGIEQNYIEFKTSQFQSSGFQISPSKKLYGKMEL